MYMYFKYILSYEIQKLQQIQKIISLLKSEVCLSGYWKHKETQVASAPLTLAETELKEVKQVFFTNLLLCYFS